MSEILEKLEDKSATVGVVGLGYVGLPLLLSFAEKGYHVIGFDIDEKKINSLSEGQSYIKHIDSSPIRQALEKELLIVTTDFSQIEQVDAVLICVPTPLTKHHEPDLSYVLSTLDHILPFLQRGQLVCLESTTYPGTTEEELRPLIEAQKFVIGKDIYLVYSPEREDPGNEEYAGNAIPKVVGGTTEKCLEVGKKLYETICDKVVPVSSTQVAEFAKLLENIYRAVNIGLVNEMKMIADAMGIDIWEVIQAAASKPFGFKAFYPGPGLGGHCIPIDPFYLTWKAREYGFHTRFIELAGEINKAMPQYVVGKVVEVLNQQHKSLNGSKILVMGLAYKADVDDMRESPSLDLLELLQKQGVEVAYYDPHIPTIPSTRDHNFLAGMQSISWREDEVSKYDVVLISTGHKIFNLEELAAWSPCIVDSRDVMRGSKVKSGQVTKA